MSERIHALAQLLLGKSSVEECSVDELKDLANQYPYFAPAQFLLLQKLKQAASPEVEAQQQKAVLYYHDPLQFDYFLSAEKFYIDESVISQKKLATPTDVEPGLENTQPVETVSTPEENFTEANAIEEKPVQGLTQYNDQESETAESIASSPDASDELTELHSEEALPLAEEEKNEPEASAEEETVLPATKSFAETTAPIGLTEQATPPREEAAPSEPEMSPEIEANNGSNPVHTNGEPLLFEPYHTVDYFASQGIKITADDIPKDKLGKQLRSFTEWLKMMKRLPASEMSKTPESTSEKNVETMANYSVAESEVVTEAMAEVWAKQGAREKAAETYNKLSLLNPSKRAYFAAKIENLKGS